NAGHSLAWRSIWGIYSKLKDYESALIAARRVAELEPNDPDSWYFLGVAENKSGNLPQAIVALEKATQLNPSHVRAWERLARIHYHVDQYDLARNACLRTTKLEPANAGNWHGLASACRKLGRTEDAVKAYEQVLRI